MPDTPSTTDSVLIKYADKIYQEFVSKRYGIQACSGISKSDDELFAEKECVEHKMIQDKQHN